ncbi:MAG: hypothetical protein IJU44_08340 [Kiritimatiellae bacterium]|nr:hypothetical protein [Kiritimatiellia bacterium]
MKNSSLLVLQFMQNHSCGEKPMFLAFSNFLFTSAFVPHSYRGIVKHLDSRTGNNNTKSILDNFRKWIVNGNKPRPATLINLSKNSRYGISCAKLVRDLYETDKVDNDRLNRILRECADNKNKVHETGHTLQELADKAFGNVNQKMSEQSLRRYLTPESIINPSLLQTIVYAFYDVVLDEKIKLKMTRDDLFHVWATLVSKLHVLDCLDIDNPGFADKRYKIAGESPISKSFFRKSVSRLPEWIQFARERIFQLSEG